MRTNTTKPAPNLAVEPFFEEEIQLTRITEYGVSWEDLTSGRTPPPPQGARFDLHFEGSLSGPSLRGQVWGIDYLEVRADGQFRLNIFASLLTDDGETIFLQENGTLTPQPDGTGRLQLNMQFSTAAPGYEWINGKQGWGSGLANMQESTAFIHAYAN